MGSGCGKVVAFSFFQGTEHLQAASSRKGVSFQLRITHSQTEILRYSALLISHFSFTSFFVQVQAVFTASLNLGAHRKSKPLLGFLQSIKQYLQQTHSVLPA